MAFNIQQIFQMMNSPQIKSMMSSSNPRMYALNLIKQSPNANSEIGRNIINMLENNDMNGLEQYGKNMLQSQGIDPNQVEAMMKNMRM